MNECARLRVKVCLLKTELDGKNKELERAKAENEVLRNIIKEVNDKIEEMMKRRRTCLLGYEFKE